MGTLLPGRVAALSACSVSVPRPMSWEPALPRICSSGLPGLAAATARGGKWAKREEVVWWDVQPEQAGVEERRSKVVHKHFNMSIALTNFNIPAALLTGHPCYGGRSAERATLACPLEAPEASARFLCHAPACWPW